MIHKVILTRAEVCDVLALVFRYNDEKATEFLFRTADNGEMFLRDFIVEIACEGKDLQVRTTPESQHQQTYAEAMTEAAKVINSWQKKRSTQSSP